MVQNWTWWVAWQGNTLADGRSDTKGRGWLLSGVLFHITSHGGSMEDGEQDVEEENDDDVSVNADEADDARPNPRRYFNQRLRPVYERDDNGARGNLLAAYGKAVGVFADGTSDH